jgi:energy-coupling factor transporter ATP-binding protein EcfA2
MFMYLLVVRLHSATDFNTVFFSCGRNMPAIVSNVTLDIDTASRIAFVGCNGEGKSTLLATIAGDLAPLKGQVTTHPRLRVAYFAQHHAKVWSSLPIHSGVAVMAPSRAKNHCYWRPSERYTSEAWSCNAGCYLEPGMFPNGASPTPCRTIEADSTQVQTAMQCMGFFFS